MKNNISELEKEIDKRLDEIYPPTFAVDLGDHAEVRRGKQNAEGTGLIMLSEEEHNMLENIRRIK